MGDADRKALYARMEAAGHTLKRLDDGSVEYFDHGEFHGGPECALCYYMPCEHCLGPACEIEPCKQYEKAYIGFSGDLFKASWERMVLLAALRPVAEPSDHFEWSDLDNACRAYLALRRSV